MPNARRSSPIRRGRIKRDAIIVAFALTLASVDVLFLGARTSTLTFCTGLLLSPLALRYDEARREDDHP